MPTAVPTEEQRTWFGRYCTAELRLRLDGFTRLLVDELGEDVQDCARYYAAFVQEEPQPLASGDGMTFEQFALGMQAMSWQTEHGGEWGLLRLRYIFRFFDVDGDGMLSLDEFKALVHRILIASHHPSAAFQAGVDEQTAIEAAKFARADKLSLDSFVEAVTTQQFRNTSRILRFAVGAEQHHHGHGHGHGHGHQKGSSRDSPPTTPPDRRLDETFFVAPASSSAVSKKKNATTSVLPAFRRYEITALPNGTYNMRVPQADDAAFNKTGIARFGRVLEFQHAEQRLAKIAQDVVDRVFLEQVPLLHNVFSLCTPAELIILCEGARNVLRTDSTVVSIPSPVKIFGDIHGQFNDMLAFFDRFGRPHAAVGDIEEVHYLFLGDFVDRGAYSLEVVTLLFALKVNRKKKKKKNLFKVKKNKKVLYPDRVLLIRGNHEVRAINKSFGFFFECQRRLPQCAPEDVWEAVNDAFDWLPLAGLISGLILCVHGGIGRIQTVDEIRQVQRPIREIDNQSLVALDLLWSDPTNSDSELGYDVDSPKKKKKKKITKKPLSG